MERLTRVGLAEEEPLASVMGHGGLSLKLLHIRVYTSKRDGGVMQP